MRDDDKRPPLRRTVHTESQRQTHIQECLRQDTRGMREKARRADKNHESRNRRDEKDSEERIMKEGRPRTVAPQNLRCSRQRKHFILYQKDKIFLCLVVHHTLSNMNIAQSRMPFFRLSFFPLRRLLH